MLQIATFALLSQRVNAAGPNGVDDGWAIDNGGHPYITPAHASQISSGGTGWMRVSMRRIPGQLAWDAQHLGYYDTAIDNARAAGLQVLILIGEGSVPGGQSAWNENNYEVAGGDGLNGFIDSYVNDAVLPIVQHFHDRVKLYELWNEPNAWTSNPAPGVYTGGTFIYPSNYSWVLTKSWIAVHVDNDINDVVLFSGGVFGHSIGGYSYGRAGAQYLDDVYNVGIHRVGSFSIAMDKYGSYPLDGIGQHLYIDQGGITTAGWVQQYLDWVHQAYTGYEGTDTAKKVFMTEVGWPARTSAEQDRQDQNLRIAFQTMQATTWVQMAIWFRWQDVVSPPLYFGVLDPSGMPKQAYASYRAAQTYEGRFADGTIHDGILSYYLGLGSPRLGNPYDDGQTAWVHWWGRGYAQDCDGGSNGRLIIMSSDNGTYQLNDIHGLLQFYSDNDGIDSFGYPLDEEYQDGDGTRQDFESGYLTWDPIDGVVAH